MSHSLAQHRQVRDVADSQLGLITAAQLQEIGVHRRTTSRRSAGGMWTRVPPGIHLVDGGAPSRRQRELAALLYAGDLSLLTGLAALRRHGFRALRLQETADDEAERPEPVHVLIPHARRRKSTGFVRVERTHRLPETGSRITSLAVAPIARSVGDAARRLRTPSDALAVVAEAVQRGFVPVADLDEELRLGPRQGSGLFRDALVLVSGGAQSVPEGVLLRLLDAASIPHVVYNASLVTAGGRFLAKADAWLDDVGVAVEVDSVEHHATEHGFQRTVRRNARYAAAGVTVVTVLPSDLRDRPASVLRQITDARAAADRRTRPDVYVADSITPSSGRDAWRWGA
jgi:hypothetical protein